MPLNPHQPKASPATALLQPRRVPGAGILSPGAEKIKTSSSKKIEVFE